MENHPTALVAADCRNAGQSCTAQEIARSGNGRLGRTIQLLEEARRRKPGGQSVIAITLLVLVLFSFGIAWHDGHAR